MENKKFWRLAWLIVRNVLVHPFTEAIVGIFGAVGIGILMEEGFYKKLWFWPIAAVYAILVLWPAWLKYNDKCISFCDKKAMKGIREVLSTWAFKTRDSEVEIHEIIANPPKGSTKKDIAEAKVKAIDDNVSFQSAALTVVGQLSRVLNEEFGEEVVAITVYQRIDDTKYAMIASSAKPCSKKGNSVKNIPKKTEAIKGEVPYQTYLFAHNQKVVAVLPNRAEVDGAKAACEEYQGQDLVMEQYIGKCGLSGNQDAVFLLQVCVFEKAYFGKEVGAIKKFAEKVLSPYVEFLEMAYEQRRLQMLCVGDK